MWYTRTLTGKTGCVNDAQTIDSAPYAYPYLLNMFSIINEKLEYS